MCFGIHLLLQAFKLCILTAQNFSFDPRLRRLLLLLDFLRSASSDVSVDDMLHRLPLLLDFVHSIFQSNSEWTSSNAVDLSRGYFAANKATIGVASARTRAFLASYCNNSGVRLNSPPLGCMACARFDYCVDNFCSFV